MSDDYNIERLYIKMEEKDSTQVKSKATSVDEDLGTIGFLSTPELEKAEVLENLALGSTDSKELDPKADLKKVPMIVHREQAPDWLIDNKYILYGYRVDFQRKRDLVKSLFMKHNELLNIWTHLLGGVFFILLVFYMIFYFDLFSTVYNKVKDFLSQKNLELMKQAFPDLLKKVE